MKRKKIRAIILAQRFFLIFLLSWITTASHTWGVGSTLDQRLSRQEAMEKILDIAGVKPGLVIGEVGAGGGGFTSFLVERMGESGKIYANDIDKDSLDILERKGFKIVETVLGGTDNPNFPVHNLDMVIMRNVFHDLEHPLSMMENIKKYLKPDASLVVVEPHSSEPSNVTSLPMHLLTEKEFLSIVEQSSYTLLDPVEIPSWWSVYVFKVDKNKEKTVWPDWLEKFRADVKKIQEFENNMHSSSVKKRIAWERILNSYRDDNPETTEDNELREYIQKRIAWLSEKTEHTVSSPKQIEKEPAVELRSVYDSIDQDDIEDTFKRLGFGVRVRIRVKSGDFPNLYEKMTPEGDPVVLDSATGLMWHPNGSEETLDYYSAQEWIDDLNLRNYAGYSDWRLPTAEEVASIIESERKNGKLYIDPAFSDVQDVIWTGDSYYPGRSWLVEFIRAGFADDLKIHIAWVRPVRSSKQSIKHNKPRMLMASADF